MSSIMDRLREVEGAASPGRACGEKSQDARSGAAEDHLAETGRASGRIARRYLALAGALTVFAVFVVWRPWRGEPSKRLASHQLGTSAESREASRGTGLASAPGSSAPFKQVHKTPQERKPAQTPQATSPAEPEEKEPSAPEVSQPKEPVRLAATGDSRPAEASVTREEEGSEDTLASAKNQLPEERATPTSPPQTQAVKVLSAEEDEKTKSILLNLKVTGVYKDASGYLAFIDGETFQKGDKIKQIEIAEIASERITFAFKGKRYNLRLR